MKQVSFQQKEQEQIQELNTQRWDAVILGSLVLTGSSYCMQEVPTIHGYLQTSFTAQGIVDYHYDHYINISQSISLGILIFFASFIGSLSDKYKPGIIIILQTLLLSLSQFMIYLSVYSLNFWFLFVGRMILFVQCSSMFITVKVFVNNLTSDQLKGVSLGILTTSVSAFGINLLLEPYLVSQYGLTSSTFISFIVASTSFILSVACFQIEHKVLHQQQTQLIYLNMEEIDDREAGDKEQKVQQLNNTEKGYFEQMRELSTTYWVFNPIMFLSIIVSTVIEISGPAIIAHEWKYETMESTQISSIGLLMSLFVSVFGYFIDKINRDFELLILVSIIQLTGIILLSFFSPIIGFIVFGIALSFRVALISPLLTKLVPKYSLGKAFGLIRSLKDFFGMLVFLFISVTVKSTHSYRNIFYLLILFCSLILTLSVILYFIGKRKQH